LALCSLSITWLVQCGTTRFKNKNCSP
jgi:hypothetical protein